MRAVDEDLRKEMMKQVWSDYYYMYDECWGEFSMMEKSVEFFAEMGRDVRDEVERRLGKVGTF